MLFRQAGVRSGERVLVHGAAGNVGAYTVQFAHAVGAYVIASVLSAQREVTLQFGADEVISLSKDEMSRLQGTVDTVIDTVGGVTQKKLFAYVRKGGQLISSVSAPDAELSQRCELEAKFILVDANTEELQVIANLPDAQPLLVRIGAVLPLREARQAHEMQDGQRARPAGKMMLEALSDS